MEYGFVALNGKSWTNNNVDIYNKLSAQIELEPNNERLKDERHRFFLIASLKETPKRKRIGVMEDAFTC